MKDKVIFVIGMIAVLVAACQNNQVEAVVEENDASKYDSALAVRLGADDYGMSQYVMAFLKRGPNKPKDSVHGAELQKAHLDNIGRMAEEGTLALAGPFIHDGDLRGIYIFNVKTIEEAEALTHTDPAIQYGSLEMELIPWYGSAAVKLINEYHSSLTK